MKYYIILLIIIFSACKKSDKNPPALDTDSSGRTEIDQFEASKARIDSLFYAKKDTGEFYDQDTRTSLLIGNLFGKNGRYAALQSKINDSVSRVVVLKQSVNRNDWDTIFYLKIDSVSTGGVFNDLLQLSDFNGDNVPDLKIVKKYWDMHPGDFSDLWLYDKDRFQRVIGFDSIVSAEYDKQTNKIYSYISTSCADMAMYFGTFKLNDHRIEKIQEMNCDCCYRGDSCMITIFGKKPYAVSIKAAHLHVPSFFAERLKQKLEME